METAIEGSRPCGVHSPREFSYPNSYKKDPMNHDYSGVPILEGAVT